MSNSGSLTTYLHPTLYSQTPAQTSLNFEIHSFPDEVYCALLEIFLYTSFKLPDFAFTPNEIMDILGLIAKLGLKKAAVGYYEKFSSAP